MDIVERLRGRKSAGGYWREKEAADEIERLREALQFYASKNNYEKKKVWTTTLPQYEPDGYKIVSQYHTPVLSDNGERARAAMKEGE
jgi:hypothetical protein